MTDFTDAIAARWDSTWAIFPGAAKSCDDCANHLTREEKDALPDEDWQAFDEGSFSWAPCDSCGTTLGGDRHAAHAWQQATADNRLGDLCHVDICTDCLLFHANGDQPESWSAN